jgi:hypothetical protein
MPNSFRPPPLFWLSAAAVACGWASGFASEPEPPREAVSLSVRDHGAVGDGVADDSAAFTAAFAAAGRAAGARVHLPAGRYRLASQVAVDLAADRDGGLAITGDGQGVTVILVDNPAGGIRVDDPRCRTQVTIAGLSFRPAREAAGTAIEVSSRRGGGRNFRSLTVRDVDIRGGGENPRSRFAIGILARNQWRPLFDNVVFAGVADPASSRDRTDASPLFLADCGFAADGCYAPTFEHCYAWGAKTGYRVVSEGPQEGPEDGSFRRCTANLVRVGIDVRTPTIEPQLVIDACHVNARDVGIRLEKRKFFHIVHSLLYGLDHVDGAPYVDIDLIDCRAGLVSGNIFQSPARHNLVPEPRVDHTMIRIDGGCRDILVADNTFNAKGRSVVVASEAKQVEIRGSRFSNPLAEPPAAPARSRP